MDAKGFSSAPNLGRQGPVAANAPSARLARLPEPDFAWQTAPAWDHALAANQPTSRRWHPVRPDLPGRDVLLPAQPDRRPHRKDRESSPDGQRPDAWFSP